MRISIVGNNSAARTLKGYVEKSGYLVTNVLPTYVINLEESIGDVIVDGIDSELERRIIYHMEDLGVGKFILQRANGIRSDREIRIIYPIGRDEIVARAIARTISEKPSRKFWSKKLFLLPLLLLATNLQAQQFVYGRAWDSVTVSPVDYGDSANRALRVNVVASSTSGSDVNLLSINGSTLTGANVVDGANTAFRVNCVIGCGSGGLTDTQLRATPVPISGTVTATGPLTDTQLRATPVPVSGTVTVGTFPDNEPINLAQVGATTVVNGGLAGSLAVGGTAASNASINQNPLLIAGEALSTQPTAATTGNQRRIITSLDGAVYTREGGPVLWQCSLNAIAASLTQCVAAPGAGLRNYITWIWWQSTTTTAGTGAIQYGTGSNCGTGTTALLPASAAANRYGYPASNIAATNFSFLTPLVPGVNTAICAIGVATNTLRIDMGGYTAP